jgi:hypothetical protein
MQNVGPEAQDLRHLLGLLDHALGTRGVRLLAATSVYPELLWPLTLALRSAVGGLNAQLDNNLLAVSRLSWFRNGWMPHRARTLLQQALTQDKKNGSAA